MLADYWLEKPTTRNFVSTDKSMPLLPAETWDWAFALSLEAVEDGVVIMAHIQNS